MRQHVGGGPGPPKRQLQLGPASGDVACDIGTTTPPHRAPTATTTTAASAPSRHLVRLPPCRPAPRWLSRPACRGGTGGTPTPRRRGRAAGPASARGSAAAAPRSAPGARGRTPASAAAPCWADGCPPPCSEDARTEEAHGSGGLDWHRGGGWVPPHPPQLRPMLLPPMTMTRLGSCCREGGRVNHTRRSHRCGPLGE